MNPLHAGIVDRIKTAGPLPFAAFMQLALYDHQHGYYSKGTPRTGWGGHFVTSPELDPSFGTMWASAFRDVWRAAGMPDDFEIAEIGPGEGGFARSVLEAADADFEAALTYRLVERVPAARSRQEALLEGRRATWSASVTELPSIAAGCVFANEILDNLPVHLVEMCEGELMEVCVDERDGRLVFTTRPASNPGLEAFLERNGMVLSEGGRAEVTLAAESLIAHVCARLQRGALFFVDYGMTAGQLMEAGGSLAAYSAAGADTDVLASPGERDITAHANWTSVAGAMKRAGLNVIGPLTQREALLSLGAADIQRSLKEDHDRALGVGRGADAVAALSRRQAIGALLDPGGLGGLGVIAGIKGIENLSLFD